jgi:hypothetical protein
VTGGKGRRLEYVILDEAQVLPGSLLDQLRRPQMGDEADPTALSRPVQPAGGLTGTQPVQPYTGGSASPADGLCNQPSPGGGLLCSRTRHDNTTGHTWVHRLHPGDEPQ